MKSWIQFISRLLMSLIFLVSGIQKLLHFAQTEAVIAQHGLPMARFCAAGAIFIEIVGGLALVLGLRTKAAALIMAALPRADDPHLPRTASATRRCSPSSSRTRPSSAAC